MCSDCFHLKVPSALLAEAPLCHMQIAAVRIHPLANAKGDGYTTWENILCRGSHDQELRRSCSPDPKGQKLKSKMRFFFGMEGLKLVS